MAWRDTMDDWTARLQSLQPLFLPITIAAVLIAFAPARVAATLLGVLTGIGLSSGYISRVPQGAKMQSFGSRSQSAPTRPTRDGTICRRLLL